MTIYIQTDAHNKRQTKKSDLLKECPVFRERDREHDHIQTSISKIDNKMRFYDLFRDHNMKSS